MADPVTTVGNSSNSLKDYRAQQALKNSKLDQEAFLKLLVAQMSNQNPLEPTTDTEFIAQLAQFSTLEQMTNLTASMSAQQAYSLVGKYVYVSQINPLSGQPELAMGRVDGVLNQGGEYFLMIGENAFKLSDVEGVVQVDDVASILGQTSSLVGKNVKATYTEDGKTYETIGIISKIFVKNGLVYAQVGNKDVSVGTITDIYSSLEEPPPGTREITSGTTDDPGTAGDGEEG